VSSAVAEAKVRRARAEEAVVRAFVGFFPEGTYRDYAARQRGFKVVPVGRREFNEYARAAREGRAPSWSKS